MSHLRASCSPASSQQSISASLGEAAEGGLHPSKAATHLHV